MKVNVAGQQDAIARDIAQLDAMLTLTYGAYNELFRLLNDEAADAYMWACHDKLVGIRNAIAKLDALKIVGAEHAEG